MRLTQALYGQRGKKYSHISTDQVIGQLNKLDRVTIGVIMKKAFSGAL